jgi:hypothetical protein
MGTQYYHRTMVTFIEGPLIGNILISMTLKGIIFLETVRGTIICSVKAQNIPWNSGQVERISFALRFPTRELRIVNPERRPGGVERVRLHSVSTLQLYGPLHY